MEKMIRKTGINRCLMCITRSGSRIQSFGIDAQAPTRLRYKRSTQPREKRNRGYNLKINERSTAYPTNFLHVAHVSDPG